MLFLLNGSTMSSLFSPFKLKSVTLRNRIVVSPMCQYMAENGFVNDWHQAHYAMLARGGSGLVIVEATAVSPEGRITPGDVGIWHDEQGASLANIAAAIESAGAVPGIQIGHAGRKAGCTPPWDGGEPLDAAAPEAWQALGPSAVPFVAGSAYVPQAMTRDDIRRVQQDFVAAASRAADAGFRWIELHFAHGFLGQSFLSRHANRREDEYGGSLENRARFLIETIQAVREAWPAALPLTARLGVAEFSGADSGSLAEARQVLQWMKDAGLDLVDVGLALSTPDESVPWGPNMMVPYAATIRSTTGLAVGTSWMITSAREADRHVRDGKLDLVYLARALLGNPHWPFQAARELCLEDPASVLPTPYGFWLKNWVAKESA
jgi:2,4-dienoyl-CoA reductase-like NADH-dependent reductase (Old Yellow Enzyme family)